MPREWIDLGALEDVPVGGGKYVVHAQRAYAVIRPGPAAEVRVMDDHCPHAGASLSGGYMAEGCIVCPWHGWAFDVKTGECPDNPQIVVRTYEVRVTEGRVFAELPGL